MSALLHAATMIVAGAYLAFRCSFLAHWIAGYSLGLLWVGLVTSVLAGFLACGQYDLNSIVAYSTCSHIALMFCAVGSNVASVGVFHLALHAGAKAALFMLAGCLIYLMGDEQDIRGIGSFGIIAVPLLGLMLFICVWSLAGFPGLAGSVSKDGVIAGIWVALHGSVSVGNHNLVGFVVVAVAVFWSSGYSMLLSLWLSLASLDISRARLLTVSQLVTGSGSAGVLVLLLPALFLGLSGIFWGYLWRDLVVGCGSDVFAMSLNLINFSDSESLVEWVPSWVKQLVLALVLVPVCAGLYLWGARGWDWSMIAGGYVARFWAHRGYWDGALVGLVALPLLALSHRVVLRNLDAGLLEWCGVWGMLSLYGWADRGLSGWYSGYVLSHLVAFVMCLVMLVGWNVGVGDWEDVVGVVGMVWFLWLYYNALHLSLLVGWSNTGFHQLAVSGVNSN